MTARHDGEWLRCAKCGRKLGRKVGNWNDIKFFPAVEIKCHSCKEINYIMIDGGNKKADSLID